MDSSSGFELRGISKAFARHRILDHASLRGDVSQFLVLSGPPASGKSVIARIVCGFQHPDSGSVSMGGADITPVSPGKRGIGYVPQSFALFPHYSVGANISYPLDLARTPAQESRKRVAFICEMLRISDLLDKRVDQISGGQKQRVAIARGLVKACALYVLDDPLVGLDFKLREQLVIDLRSLQREMEASFLYLTSDPLEPLMLGDGVAVLDNGRISAIHTPTDAYQRPQTLAMARALGFPRMNLIDIDVDTTTRAIRSPLFRTPARLTGAGTLARHATLAVRPEAIRVDPVDDALAMDARVQLVEDLGADYVVHAQTPAGSITVCHPSRQYRARHGATESLTLWIRPQDVRLYASDTGDLLDCSIGGPGNE
ncbi:MAG: ABC transporter ATP-binding protein [Candidimonas sp.]|nr:MAG: ABC transporter ATP-binding protein [Candidimonas sp.]